MAVVSATSQLTFAARLLRQLLRRNEPNVLVSPVSVGLALGMAAAGAQGKTRTALEHALGLDAEAAATRAERLAASLGAVPASVTVELANSLWTPASLPLSEPYADAMQKRYRAQVRQLDFSSPGAAKVINDSVRRATHGEIVGVLDSIDADSILVLVNATYFHGLWLSQFDSGRTIDHEFTIGSGEVTTVRIMQKKARFTYVGDGELQAVRLPYRGERFSLLVVLPRKHLAPSAFSAIADPAIITRVRRGLRDQEGFLGLPKVRLTYSANLEGELLEMGMGPAFAADADFSHVFGRLIPSRVSRVVQKTQLDIDEDGTTAAAATAVNYSLSASIQPPARPFKMVADRPFLVALLDDVTDELLFLGVIGDPGGS